jgi:hypothetical protein
MRVVRIKAVAPAELDRRSVIRPLHASPTASHHTNEVAASVASPRYQLTTHSIGVFELTDTSKRFDDLTSHRAPHGDTR